MALAKMPLWQLLYFEDLPFLQKPVLKINRFSKHFQQKKNKVYIISRVYIYIYIFFNPLPLKNKCFKEIYC